jgi:hypothetical protein
VILELSGVYKADYMFGRWVEPLWKKKLAAALPWSRL